MYLSPRRMFWNKQTANHSSHLQAFTETVLEQLVFSQLVALAERSVLGNQA